MALHIYVMPLWRFKAGYYESSIEKNLGIRPKWATLHGVLSPSYLFNRLKAVDARKQVARVARDVSRQNGRRVKWNDNGAVAMSEQAFYGFESLRAYAAWIDYRQEFPEFEPLEDWDYYKHPVWKKSDQKDRSCPHLVEHDCYGGYFLPCEFERLVQVEPYEIRIWKFSRSVGSTHKLLAELRLVGEHLQFDSESWLENDAQKVEFKKVGNMNAPSDDLFYVKWSYAQLLRAARVSRDHSLPIIFCG